MSYEIEYEDVDETTGEPLAKVESKMMKQSLEPKTPLQVELLAVSKAKRFATPKERNRWRKLEPKGATDEDRLQEAWLYNCIGWGKRVNAGRVAGKMPYTSVISRAENDQAAENWKNQNREKVLKKKSAEEMKALLTQAEEAQGIYNLDDEE